MSLAYVWIFIVLLAAGAPIAFALLLAPTVSLALDGETSFFQVLTSRLFNGIDSFPLMAVPFFLLAGEVMNRGGITQGIVTFAQTMIGHVRGGLAQVNILSSVLFAGLSGSAVADASALGKMLIPAMEKAGYSRTFASAITASSSVIGPIIPPSGIMILYAFVMNVSVGGLFLAGLIPGLLICAVLMGVTHRLAKVRNFPISAQKATLPEQGRALRIALPALFTPILLLGGIVSGIFTPTEAAAVAAIYALIISLVVTKTLGVHDLPNLFRQAAYQSGIVLFLVGTAVGFAWVVTVSGLASQASDGITSLTDNPLILLFLINLFLFFIGMFLDAGPAILILGPILAPIFISLGVDPLHFAVIMCLNVTVGLVTPPVGLVLFVTASLSETSPEAIAKEMWPYLLAKAAVIFLVTFVPALSLTLPRLAGLG